MKTARLPALEGAALEVAALEVAALEVAALEVAVLRDLIEPDVFLQSLKNHDGNLVFLT